MGGGRCGKPRPLAVFQAGVGKLCRESVVPAWLFHARVRRVSVHGPGGFARRLRAGSGRRSTQGREVVDPLDLLVDRCGEYEGIQMLS